MTHECLHEEQIQGQSRKIESLETRADYKEESIKELKADMKELKKDMKELKDDINSFLLKSVNDDSDLDKRVTTLESTVNVLKWICTLVFGSGVIWVLYSFIH